MNDMAPLRDQDREEATASAGAKAEAKGRPMRANPHRQHPPLRNAWASGWQISRADRMRAEAQKRASQRA